MMRNTINSLRITASCSVLLIGLSGCNSTKATDALDVAPPAAANDVTKSSDLEGFCPQVTLREGTASITKYEKGGEADPARIIYQGSISDVTRTCNRVDGQVKMTVAVAGKVVPGPKASGDPTSLPIRVAILQGETVVYSEIQQFQVTVVAGQAASQFVFKDPNPLVPLENIKATQVFVGFDEGPVADKKKSDPAG